MAEQKQTTDKQTESLYVPADFYMVRAPALPAHVFLRLSSAGHVGVETIADELDELLQKGRQECAEVLLELATRPDVMQALTIASPSLLHGIERLRQGEETGSRQKRAYAGLLRYLIRMSTRPTPFGLFSGVGLGTFAERTELSLGTSAIGHFRARPDMGWLLAVLKKLEEDNTLVEQIAVRLNQIAYLAGERAVLPFADTYGEADRRAISLRATSVVHKVFELTQQPLLYSELCTVLQAAFPRATEDQVKRLLWQLWEHHFLISQIHPPLTHAQPLLYVREQLTKVQGIKAVKEGLSKVVAGGEALDRAGIGGPLHLIEALVKDQEAVLPSAERENLLDMEKDKLPLQVDAALQLRATALHSSIGKAAARAATFLLRQTPLVDGFSHLKEYRALFQEKYGEGAEVPLLDLLSPENGLDAPVDYNWPPRTYLRPSRIQPQEHPSRTRLLLNLTMEALSRGNLEVVLTEDMQRSLERWSPEIEHAPLSLEIYLQVQAASREALDRGEWSALLGRNMGSQSAGRTFGRFFDLLGTPGLEALGSLFKREEELLPDVIFAELSYQPWKARQANVAIRPPLRTYEIAVGITPSVPPERVITLSDLVVGVRDGRFYVRSQRLGKHVLVCQSHMLNTRTAPNACRFITEIANDGRPQLSTFDWGEAAHASFLPRLVLKVGEASKLVLTPARWHMQENTVEFEGVGSTEARWFRGLQEWRKLWRVPRYVYLSEVDQRLLLDLEHPLMAEELRNAVKKAGAHGRVALDELLPDFEHLWLRDTQGDAYFSEIVVPLLRADAFAQKDVSEDQKRPEAVSRPVLSAGERRRFPGEDWTYLKLYTALSQQEQVIAGPLREIVSALQQQDLIDRWFFIRYSDPEPHLRLRFHAREGVAAQKIYSTVLPWSAALARHGLLQRSTLDTYDREVERYGGPEAIDLIEQVFTIDSTNVSAIVAARYANRVTLDPLALAVYTLDQFFHAWGWDMPQRLQWTQALVTGKYAFRKEFHTEGKRFSHLLAPQEHTEQELVEQRMRLRELMQPQEGYLATPSKEVRKMAAEGRLWVPEEALMRSLAHMHINRLLGTDRAQETQAYAFWRYTLESLAHRSIHKTAMQ